MTAAARRAGRSVRRRRRARTCRSTSGCKTLEHWLEPVRRAGERPHHGRPTGVKVAAGRHRHRRRRSAASRPPVHVYLRRRFEDRPAEPEILADGWYYDSAISAVRRRSRARGLRGGRLVRRARRSTARSTASPRWCAASAGELRRAPDRLRAHLRARHRPRRDRAGRGPHRPEHRAVMLAAEASPDFPILTATVVLPAIGALVTALVSRRRARARPGWSPSLFSVATGALTVAILVALRDRRRRLPDGRDSTTWIRDLGISWHLGVDGISLFLVVLTGVLFPIAILGAPPHHDDEAVPRLAAAARGRLHRRVPRARPLPLLRDVRDRARADVLPHRRAGATANRRYAAMKFFLYTMFGSAFMLVGLVAHRGPARRRAPAATSPSTWSTIASDQGAIATTTARWLFLAFAIAFAVKVPLFPRAHLAARRPHRGADRRLGDPGRRHAEARHLRVPALRPLPVPGGVGLLRPADGHARRRSASSTAPSCATMQKDLKRLVAYSSVAHLGFIALGTFSLTTQGLEGSVLQMVNHGISTGALFLLVGMIYERRHTREIAELKGLQKVGADLRRRVHGRDAVVDRPARPQRLRRRVPDPARARSSPAAGGRWSPPPA